MKSTSSRSTAIMIFAAAAIFVLLCAHHAAPQSPVARSKPSPEGQTQQKASASSDTKLRLRMSSGAGAEAFETVTYVKGQRRRSETRGAGMDVVNVVQCDLGRNLTINERARTYFITGLGEAAVRGPAAAAGAPITDAAAERAPEARRGGVVNVTNTVTDTGERKELFGFTARHIKTSMVWEPSPDACDPESSRIETDGWYIDFSYDFDCPGQREIPKTPWVRQRPGCQDEIRTKTVGSAKLGFPVLLTTTMHHKDGTTTTTTQEVVELARTPLDAALFDIPAGYTLARNAQELYGMSGETHAAGRVRAGEESAAGVPVAAGPPAAGPLVAPSAPKRSGAVRIGIVMPKAQVTSGDARAAAEAVRNTFASYLHGPSIEVVALTALLPLQAAEEARQSQCDYVLYASLTQKKGGGGGMFGRALGNIAGAAVGHIPVNTAGEAAARSTAAAGVYTTASIAGSVKAKDELTLEYRLEATDGARPGTASTVKAKVRSDGEDVLTPLIEKAATAVVSVVMKK